MKAIFLRLTGLIPLLIGIFLAQHAGRTLLEAYKSSDWLSVEGKVLSSKVGSIDASGSTRKNPVPIARVEYVYEVDGISYTSSRISHNDYGSNIKGQQQKIVDRYPQDSTVKVFYSPIKPSSSILEKRVPIASYLTIGMGVIFILVGYFFIFKAPKYL